MVQCAHQLERLMSAGTCVSIGKHKSCMTFLHLVNNNVWSYVSTFWTQASQQELPVSQPALTFIKSMAQGSRPWSCCGAMPTWCVEQTWWNSYHCSQFCRYTPPLAPLLNSNTGKWEGDEGSVHFHAALTEPKGFPMDASSPHLLTNVLNCNTLLELLLLYDQLSEIETECT